MKKGAKNYQKKAKKRQKWDEIKKNDENGLKMKFVEKRKKKKSFWAKMDRLITKNVQFKG